MTQFCVLVLEIRGDGLHILTFPSTKMTSSASVNQNHLALLRQKVSYLPYCTVLNERTQKRTITKRFCYDRKELSLWNWLCGLSGELVLLRRVFEILNWNKYSGKSIIVSGEYGSMF